MSFYYSEIFISLININITIQLIFLSLVYKIHYEEQFVLFSGSTFIKHPWFRFLMMFQFQFHKRLLIYSTNKKILDGMRRTSCYKKCHTNTVPDRVNKTFLYKRVQKPIRARHEYSWHQQTLTEMVYDEFQWGCARHAVSFQRWWWYEIFSFQLFVIP